MIKTINLVINIKYKETIYKIIIYHIIYNLMKLYFYFWYETTF